MKYLIEHKESRKWLCYDGTLTNDANKALRFDNRFTAESCLKPKTPDVIGDFGGNNVSYDYMGVNLWNQVKEQTLEKSGADLYTDFIITEHEFVTNKKGGDGE